jgi:hypothetical protein
MTQDEIIEMARDLAEKFGTRMCDENGDTHGEELYAMGVDDVVDIIKLVAAKEREACEAVCNKLSANKPNEPTSFDFRYGAGCCAQAIRARGEA